jgi:hypothetical protein
MAFVFCGAVNVEARGKHELARFARRRGVELRALRHNANGAAEREALEAVYAYERVLSENSGKKIKASRTWQMIAWHGIIRAVERVVSRPSEAKGYNDLVKMRVEAFFLSISG